MESTPIYDSLHSEYEKRRVVQKNSEKFSSISTLFDNEDFDIPLGEFAKMSSGLLYMLYVALSEGQNDILNREGLEGLEIFNRGYQSAILTIKRSCDGMKERSFEDS